MVRRCLVVTLHLLAVLGVGAAFADSTSSHPSTRIDEIHPLAEGLAETFQAINDGETSKAVEISWKLMGVGERNHVSVSEQDVFKQKWEAQLGQLRAFSQKFESIELVGLEPISSRAAFLHFVVICEKTPLSLRVATFQYRNAWYIQGMTWSPSFEERAEVMRRNMVKLPAPLHHALTIPAALAEKPSTTTTN